jgi:hypothetical protein
MSSATTPADRSSGTAADETPNEDLAVATVATQLIAEHTERLMAACRVVNSANSRRLVGVCLGAGLAAALAGVVAISLNTQLMPTASSFVLPVVVTFAGALVGLTLALTQRRGLSVHEVRLVARGLAVLIKRASTIYAHKGLPTPDRLKLEIRLGEAEAALEIAERYGAIQRPPDSTASAPVHHEGALPHGPNLPDRSPSR